MASSRAYARESPSKGTYPPLPKPAGNLLNWLFFLYVLTCAGCGVYCGAGKMYRCRYTHDWSLVSAELKLGVQVF